jgi:serine/threonine-protein kinase
MTPHKHFVASALRRIGATLCGRYRLIRLVGVGGTAAVYAGRHRNGHSVAIKILHEHLSSDPAMERLFRREALLVNKIEHSGVVPVMDDDISEGCAFLVMPLLVGETVRTRAERLRGRLPVDDVCALARAALDALAAVHARKIVHRDVKPENLFITENGVRILDFGNARFLETTGPVPSPRSGLASGTPAFMAPEQALGRSREIDGRTDLWALGATMFTLLTGRYVHDGDSSSETLVMAATRPPPLLRHVLPRIARELGEVVDRALAFDRDARWEDAVVMARALESACLATMGATPAPLTLPPPALPSADSVHGETTQSPVRAVGWPAA